MRLGLRFGMVLAVAVAAWGQPTISSVTNAFNTASGVVTPGGEVFVNGSKLASSTQSCLSGSQYLTSCFGTSVNINGYPAAIQAITSTKLTVYIPYEITGGDAYLTVTTTQGTSAGVDLAVVPALPAAAAGFYVGGVQVTAAHPANVGDQVTVFTSGFGTTNPMPPDGLVIPNPSPYYAAGIVQVTVGGLTALRSDTVDLWEIDGYSLAFVVPGGLSGNQPVVFIVDGIASAPVTIPLSGSPSALSVTTSATLGTFSPGEVQVALSAEGGNGSYTWSLQSGTLPPGLSIRNDLPFTMTPWAPSGLIGVATTPGDYHFTLGVASGTSNTTASFTMRITALTLRDGPTLPDAFVGSAYYVAGYQLAATVNGAPAAITCTPSTEGGLTLDSNCRISGSPTTAGPVTIPVTFTDGVDTVSQTLSLMVYALQITDSGELPNAMQYQHYSYTLTTAGKAPFNYLLSGSLPEGLAQSGATIFGTPTGALGKTGFTVLVFDADNNSYQKNLSIDVVGTPQPLPRLSAYSSEMDCTIGVGCAQAIAVTAGGTAPFLWSASGLPPGMTYRFGGNGTSAYVSGGDLELFGAPTQLGVFSITVTASDANGVLVTQTFPITVSPLLFDTCGNQVGCPVLANGQVGNPYATLLRVVGGTPPYHARAGGALTDSRLLPAGLWVTDTAITGKPIESGQFLPVLTFSDSAAGSNQLTVTPPLTIYGATGSYTTINYYPNLYGVVGQTFSLQLGACCGSGSYTWTAILAPPWLSLSISGLLSGIAPQTGASFVIVKATDANNSSNYAFRQLAIQWTTVSISTNALPAGALGVSYNHDLSATGVGSINWAMVPGSSLPPGLSLASSTGAITGTPTYLGAYSFAVNARDSTGYGNVRTVSLSVYSACDVTKTGIIDVADVHQLFSQAMGTASGVNDLNGDGKLNVVDIQIGANAVMGRGCSAH